MRLRYVLASFPSVAHHTTLLLLFLRTEVLVMTCSLWLSHYTHFSSYTSVNENEGEENEYILIPGFTTNLKKSLASIY